MFEKIFGIFRKKKKDDFSTEIPGDTDEDMFDLGDSEMGDDFDADTISLETGMIRSSETLSVTLNPRGMMWGSGCWILRRIRRRVSAVLKS